MAKKRRRQGELCAYCGIRPADTQDHIVPQCLFTKPLPAFMLTVPACEECNKEKGRDDHYLRDLLVMDSDGATHPTAQLIFTGKVLRSVQRNSSEVARAVLAQARYAPRLTTHGLYLGHQRSFPVDAERLDRACAFIVRGLYYHFRKERLPDTYVYDVRRIEAWDAPRVARAMHENGANGPYVLGDNIFSCQFFYAAEDPGITWWLLGFYHRVFLEVTTEPPGDQAVNLP